MRWPFDFRRKPTAERQARRKALEAVAEAEARKDTRSIHAARERLLAATTEELRASQVRHQPSPIRAHTPAPTQGAA